MDESERSTLMDRLAEIEGLLGDAHNGLEKTALAEERDAIAAKLWPQPLPETMT